MHVQALGHFIAHQMAALRAAVTLLGGVRLLASDWIPARAIDVLTSAPLNAGDVPPLTALEC